MAWDEPSASLLDIGPATGRGQAYTDRRFMRTLRYTQVFLLTFLMVLQLAAPAWGSGASATVSSPGWPNGT
jgi:hypothetical protein